MAVDFLFELGTEELPPKALLGLSQAFVDEMEKNLKQAKLNFRDIIPYATPRRLALLIRGLDEQQADQSIEKLGPNISAAFDKDGKPSKAAEGFARSNGVSVAELEQVETEKGLRLAFRSIETGANSDALLPAMLHNALAALPIPKRMRWGANREEFVRPVHWAVALYNERVLACDILGVTATNESRGHRFHADINIPIPSANDYAQTLLDQGHVVADFFQRRELIETAVKAEAEKVSGTAKIDPELLDEVTALVEWPVALSGRFEERFLEIPAEALISSMEEHQKYFPVTDGSGKLLPYFITVSNLQSSDPVQIIDGNERVIRPRLADAAFFFETDKKLALAERSEKLKTIIFQEKLGTVFDKSQRIKHIARDIASQIGGDQDKAGRAADLCKCDLLTNLVYEFDKLQGLAGYYYALHDGEDEEVARSLYEQYLPKFSGDALPESLTGITLALADRLDSLSGIFGIGQKPSGSKDPFALRRASLGVLRIIVEKKLPLDLAELISLAIAQHGNLNSGEDLAETIIHYMLDRFRAWYEEENIATEVFLAVHAKAITQPYDFHQRVLAVNEFSNLDEAASLAAANKRVSNILTKESNNDIPGSVNNALLQEPSEQTLAQQLAQLAEKNAPLMANKKYTEVLRNLAQLRDPVDAFFDNVMVMVDDAELRNNRLALLQQLRKLFLEVADISLLVPAK